MLQILSLFTCSLISTAAFATASVFTGKVVSIANDENDTLVRIGDGKKSATFKTCASFADGEELQEAFAHGEFVKANLSDPFEGCLLSIERVKAISKAETPRKPSNIR